MELVGPKPNPTDLLVGARIRMRRKGMGVSQAQLAEALGVSFQQVQKYEKGSNRVSASVLVRIARRLECRAADLLGEEDGEQPKVEAASLVQRLGAPSVGKLVDAYSALPPGLQRSVLAFVETVARETPPEPVRGGRPKKLPT